MHVKLFRVTCTILNNTISAEDAKGMQHNLFLTEHFITKQNKRQLVFYISVQHHSPTINVKINYKNKL